MISLDARRIAAVVLPLLATEVARATAEAPISIDQPLAVVVDPLLSGEGGGEPPRDVLDEGARTIDAVDVVAHARGVRPGQRVSEAAALTAGLVIARVASRALEAALGRVAEVALGLGPTVAVGPPDTIWVDVTGAAHLWGSEEAMLHDLEQRVRKLGHRTRAAIGEGPRIARALARFADRAAPGKEGRPARIAPPGRSGEAIATLPVRSLFRLDRADDRGDAAVVTLLGRLGVWTVADLARLPPAAAAARLGDRAQEVLALARGHDPAPLIPHVPAPRIVEETSLEDGVETAEPLVFVARALASRAAARLAARGEATSRIDLELLLDRSIAALRCEALRPLALAAAGAANDAPTAAPPRFADPELAIDLPAPLSHETDLLRALKAKIEATVLLAPVVAMRLTLSRIAPAPEVQLAMGRASSTRAVDPDALPALLSELSAELGPERLGVLSVRDDHRPEARSALEPPQLDAPSGGPPGGRRVSRGRGASARADARLAKAARAAFGARASDFDVALLPSPTRLMPGRAAVHGRLSRGATLVIGRRSFVVEEVAFDRRIDGARWWTNAAASRDYLRVSLRAASTSVEAWVFVDRRTGEVVLHGLWE